MCVASGTSAAIVTSEAWSAAGLPVEWRKGQLAENVVGRLADEAEEQPRAHDPMARTRSPPASKVPPAAATVKKPRVLSMVRTFGRYR